MTDDVAVELVEVASCPTAVMDGHAAAGEIPATIRRLLDPVWTFLRGGDLVTLHNVVLYHADADGSGGMTVEVGVQVDRRFGDDEAPDGIRCRELPASEVARAVHVGPYDRLGITHDAIHRWCREQGRELTGRSWEIYGDWNEDTSLLETEVAYEVTPLRGRPS